MSKTVTHSSSENLIVQFGNWIFHFRNFLFPVFYLALFIPTREIFPGRVMPDLIGLTLIFAGIFVRSITVGLAYVVRGGRDRKIYAENLVTTGIYSICRNPLYLGNILLLGGFGFFANSLLFILIFFPMFVFFYYAIMKAEEAFLFRKFGQQYELFRVSVNAIIPDFSNIKRAFYGQTFNFRKVIRKEYNSLFLYFTGLIFLLFFQDRLSNAEAMISMASLSFLYLIIKILKYQHKLD